MRSMETRLSDDLLHATQPVLARGLVNHWPLVQAANRSIDDLVAQLRGHYNGSTIGAFLGQDDQRVFYNDTFDGLNFQRIMTSLDSILDHLTDPKASRMLYVGSTAIDTTMPGLRDSNNLDFGSLDPLASFWLGTPTVIAAHFDVPDNLACVVAGRRRFTLFPPDQVENLYVGPIDRTPAGPAISLADLRDPDFDRFPRLKMALEHAQVFDLGPGDALRIPSMWWHAVESLDKVNLLINYWWQTAPSYLGRPMDALLHGVLSLRDLAPDQKKAWRKLFDHYVFDNDESTTEHIPSHARGLLDPLTDDSARKLRAMVLNGLKR